ncbi:MAG: hypothetical protein LBU66_01580 [Treponema sp.]|nr:hypothetical protein [Treponema sp.]
MDSNGSARRKEKAPRKPLAAISGVKIIPIGSPTARGCRKSLLCVQQTELCYTENDWRGIWQGINTQTWNADKGNF